ncbi:MAG: hypothetical protein HRU69_06090 [Flammeovirgaceae bacterium]|nr:MAG: hypothetical protein HRU69_06090 [Flammeovirgaceae bacterium]
MKIVTFSVISVMLAGCTSKEKSFNPAFRLIPADRFVFNSFVDCNMAEAWVGDTLRIFPGKYGEDPVWGDARELKYADGLHADEVFLTPREQFISLVMPPNAAVGTPGLHGAVWFETMYQDTKDKTGKTLYGIYHNENYPQTLPYDATTGIGYTTTNWPQGLRGPESAAAVCRIGIMKSTDGGKSWQNKGIFIEDLNDRMIRKPHNISNTFAGGVGDPSAVASGDYLYLFYGEYSYPEVYSPETYDEKKEWSGQCISVARIKISDLDNPEGKARRWDGKGFNAPHDGIGQPIPSLQISTDKGGGAASRAGQYHWGPSVSWNYYLSCWVMLMGKVEETSWRGSSIYISFNPNNDLGQNDNAIQWTTPQQLLTKPGRVLWYPSLQPMNTPEDVENKNTCLKLGKRARLFVKDSEANEYSSEYIIEFDRVEKQ